MAKYQRRSRDADLLGNVSKYSSILNLGLFAVIGIVVFKVYRLFSPDPDNKAQNESEKEGVLNYTTRAAEEGKGLTSLEKELANKGLKVSASHISQANTLNSMMDKAWVSQSDVLRLIKSMSKQTFQLVSIAYKQRELVNYRNSHPFDSDSWGNLFADKKFYGTLKYHLQVVLSDSEFKSLNQWVSIVP